MKRSKGFTPPSRRTAVASLAVGCIGCRQRLRLPGGILLHGGWSRCERCGTYTYVLPFVGGAGLVYLVEIDATEINVLASKGASHREVLTYLGILQEPAA